jgi:hypothetical protein
MPYTMQTTKIFETTRGIYWKAHLLREGVKVGIIEQEGRGGADRVIIDDPEERAAWQQHCKTKGGEELAAYALLIAETELLTNNHKG